MPDKKSILLVDDEKEVIYALEKFFAHKGYAISVATDGKEALEKLNDNPDLVVLDIKMPTVNGIDVLKEIKKNHKTVKTVILSGFADDYRDQLDELAPEVILNKPFSLDKLVQNIENQLGDKIDSFSRKYDDAVADKIHFIAKAKILIYPQNPAVYDNLIYNLRRVRYCDGIYDFEAAYGEEELLAKMNSFKPDIILIDTVNFNASQDKDLTKKIFQHPWPPKDLILFGPECTKELEETDEKKPIECFFDPISSYFNKNYIDKLAEILNQACLKHNLCERWIKRWGVDYIEQFQDEIKRIEKELEE